MILLSKNTQNINPNGKSNRQCYRDYLSWKNDIENIDSLSQKDINKMYVSYLQAHENFNKSEANSMMDKLISREKNDAEREIKSNKETKLEKKIKEIDAAKDDVKVGNPNLRKQYKPLDRKFDKWLVKNGLNPNRDRDDIWLDVEKFINDLPANTQESTKNKFRSAISFYQDNKHQRDTNSKSIRKAVKSNNKTRKNTLIDIVVDKDKLGLYQENLNHIDKTFIKNFKENNKGYIDNKHSAEGYARWYTQTTGKSITKSTNEDYSNFVSYLIEQGGLSETIVKYTGAVRFYSNHGDWKEPVAKKNQDLGVPRRKTAIVDKAWRTHEFEKALNLAYEGTCKKGGGKRPDVYFELLAMRVLGLRHDECMNLTTQQLKSLVENEYLFLTKTKGKVPRELDHAAIDRNIKYLNKLRPLLDIAEKNNYEKPFVEAFSNIAIKDKFHKTKTPLQQWIINHRDKFQDPDRVNKHGYLVETIFKKKTEIEIEKIELSAHGLRHAFAQDIYNMYMDNALKALDGNIGYKNRLLINYKNEKIEYCKKKGWKFTYMDANKDKYIMQQLMKEVARNVAENLGHHRSQITRCYLTRKIGDDTTIALNLEEDTMYSFIETEAGLEISNDYLAA